VKNRWSWLALGVGAYLAFAVSSFPAATAVRWLLPPQVAVSGVRGTVWSGSAASATLDGLPVSDLRWRVRPWTLLTGRVGANVEARLVDGFVNTNVTVSKARVQLSDLRGGTSLAALGLVPSLRGVRGQASVALSELDLENGWPARVVGDLKLAGLEIPPLMPGGNSSLIALGDYTVTFGDAPAGSPPGSVAARFVDNGGPLEVAGTLLVDQKRAYTFDALIKPRAGAQRELVDGLNIMTADPDAQGRRRLTLTGSL
jgi:general secretion pathway protein N